MTCGAKQSNALGQTILASMELHLKFARKLTRKMCVVVQSPLAPDAWVETPLARLGPNDSIAFQSAWMSSPALIIAECFVRGAKWSR